MADTTSLHRPDPAEIRRLRIETPKARARDFAASIGVTEAELVAAHQGHGATAIDAAPDRLGPLVGRLGEIMALTRNDSCVHERVGVYEPYHAGPHAAMVLGTEIDLRIFPAQWKHAFAVVEDTAEGTTKRSIQIFDAHGDAVHKIHLRATSDVAAFDALVAELALDSAPVLAPTPRPDATPAKADPARAAELREGWEKMTDTHQFLSLVHKLKMNRLGAYRVAGAPFVRQLAPGAVVQALEAAATDAIPVMIFVGNMGCIQIHGGRVEKTMMMGPWFNIMDPRFNLHLRTDHIAEVWWVTKPTRTGDAVSVEGFDKDGNLILQIFPYRKDTPPDAWNAMAAALPGVEA
ncbi:MAG: ChuX/HutX family heme-like substrate-binding protein [Gemmobacter sp.]|nr:ChuX/HutX family heme-like substrate-binding protein [Gemmobacter sp.]